MFNPACTDGGYTGIRFHSFHTKKHVLNAYIDQFRRHRVRKKYFSTPSGEICDANWNHINAVILRIITTSEGRFPE